GFRFCGFSHVDFQTFPKQFSSLSQSVALSVLQVFIVFFSALTQQLLDILILNHFGSVNEQNIRPKNLSSSESFQPINSVKICGFYSVCKYATPISLLAKFLLANLKLEIKSSQEIL